MQFTYDGHGVHSSQFAVSTAVLIAHRVRLERLPSNGAVSLQERIGTALSPSPLAPLSSLAHTPHLAFEQLPSPDVTVGEEGRPVRGSRV